MGRMLEVFKQDHLREESAEEITVDEETTDAVSSYAGMENDRQMPFIEVGSGAAGVDASADVQALMRLAPPLVRLAPILTLHQPHEPAAPKSKPLLRPRQVTYRPLSLDAGNSGTARKNWWTPFHSPGSQQAGDYQALVEELTSASAQTDCQSWLFTSLDQDVATALTLKIALATADLGKKEVVAIDAKGRRANLGEILGMPEAPGLKEVLGGEASLEEGTRDSGYSRLAIITAGQSGVGSQGRPLGLAYHHLIDQLHQRFSWIFLDAGPWRNQTELTLLASFCSGVYFVGNEEAEGKSEVAELANQLRSQGIAFKGSIVVGE